MKELRAAFGNLGVTATLPSSYWYLKGFDVKNLEQYVDWFNFMSYDIHGTWDGANKSVSFPTIIALIILGLQPKLLLLIRISQRSTKGSRFSGETG